MNSPPPCPNTITVRRNPIRKARATPSSSIPLRQPLFSPSLSRDIFSTENPTNSATENIDPPTRILSENLKIYLRIRPLTVQKNSKGKAESKNVWPKNPKFKSNSRPKTRKCNEICVQVNEDLHSVTVSTPQTLQEMKKIKSEVYEGFSHVFASEASQSDVYEEMVKPLVEDFLNGKSGMLAAIGPSGSGKTHTVFGCAKDPGMVPLALGHIFSGKELSRVFYLSMFEISSDKGKAERMIDLLHDRGDVCMQQSVLKGLQEALVCDAQQAESLIAHGMLKRATATTNSNSQSSRSQCIINIRYDSEKGDEVVDGKASSTMFTIVDLAGAEREKKTGNQGARLLESNFINNTSMVFGLCLRSLLEHQKNRNKPLQKHYQNSLLTRYMRDYLEGKKRMMLILTVKPGVEDYLDTSYLLRQASPFTKIKFSTSEEPVNLICNKRCNQAFPRAEQHKKMKFTSSEASLIDKGNIRKDFHLLRKDIAGNVVEDCLKKKIEDTYGENLYEVHLQADGFVGQKKSSLKGDYSKNKSDKDREYQIVLGLSKAMWIVLKQYKKELEEVKIDNCHLMDSLTNEKTRSLDLENELISEKMRLFDLENELKELKSLCTCEKAPADTVPVSVHYPSFSLSQCQMAELQEVNLEVSSYSSEELDQTENEKKTDPSATDSTVTSASCSGGVEEHYLQQLEDLLESSGNAEGEDFKETTIVNLCSRCQELPTSTNNTQHLICCEEEVILDMSSRIEATSQLTSVCLYESNGDAEGEKRFKDTTAVDVRSKNQELSTSTNNTQDLICCEDEIILDMPSRNEASSQLTSVCLYESSGDAEGEKGFKDTTTLDECSKSQELPTTTMDAQDSICCEDKGIVDIFSRNEATSRLTSACLYTSHKSEEDALNNVGHTKNLEPVIECEPTGSSFATCKYGSAKSFQNHKDLEDAKGEPTQLENGSTDNGPSLVEDQIVSVAAHTQTVLNSSGSPRKDDICFHMDEVQLQNEEYKLDRPVAVLSKQECDVKITPKFVLKQECDEKIVPKLASCSNFQHAEKPKRRLLPASSVLLKDISILDIKDENHKPKGGRGGKTAGMDDKNRTQGSISLYNLLTK